MAHPFSDFISDNVALNLLEEDYAFESENEHRVAYHPEAFIEALKAMGPAVAGRDEKECCEG